MSVDEIALKAGAMMTSLTPPSGGNDDDRARDRQRDEKITAILERLAGISERLTAMERVFTTDHVPRPSFEAVVRRVDANGKRLDMQSYFLIGQFLFLFILVLALFAVGVF